MPFRLPPEQTGAAAWYGPEMSQREDWLMPLTAAEIAEVESAAKPLAARNAEITAIAAHDFPLPTLGPKLKARVRDEVLNGRGFLLTGPSRSAGAICCGYGWRLPMRDRCRKSSPSATAALPSATAAGSSSAAQGRTRRYRWLDLAPPAARPRRSACGVG
jgi:hypothetical protein